MMDAILREKRIKKWHRAWKLEMIERQNPQWQDLYDELVQLRLPPVPARGRLWVPAFAGTTKKCSPCCLWGRVRASERCAGAIARIRAAPATDEITSSRDTW